jgi:hypothetical protein
MEGSPASFAAAAGSAELRAGSACRRRAEAIDRGYDCFAIGARREATRKQQRQRLIARGNARARSFGNFFLNVAHGSRGIGAARCGQEFSRGERKMYLHDSFK